MPELPEDVIQLIYKHYYQMYVLPEINEGSVSKLRKSWKRVQGPFINYKDVIEPFPYRSVLYFLNLARASHQFWDHTDEMVSITISIINLEMYNAPDGLVDYLISQYTVEQNGLGQYRVVVRSDDNRGYNNAHWADWVQSWQSKGWVNKQEEVTLVISDKVAYIKDNLDRRISYYIDFCTHPPSLQVDRNSIIVPWFRPLGMFFHWFN
jgi:hypothetical protein